MAKKLYVGNLPFSCTDADLFQEFSKFGTVDHARVITDRETGRSKGFGFVEMSNDNEALNAINGMNGQTSLGRPLTVNEARPRAEGERERSPGRDRSPSRGRGYDARA
jgi:RNA recognition motif-containing protein